MAITEVNDDNDRLWMLIKDDDDFLMHILVRLPARSIFQYMCVCKKWKNIISSPFFIQTYFNLRKERAHLLGYITTGLIFCPSYMDILPIPQSNDGQIFYARRDLKCRFLNSSGGLILARRWNPQTFHIINPLTGRNVLLPPLLNQYDGAHPCAALVCEENERELILYYKVVMAAAKKGNSLIIETLSSKTWKWTTSQLTATGTFLQLQMFHPLVVNGIIHWFTFTEHLAVYDTSDINGSKHHVQLIKLPCSKHPFQHGPYRRLYDRSIMRSSRDDAIWLCLGIRCCIEFFMLPSDIYDSYRRGSITIPSKEWVLMHKFSYAPLCRSILSEDEKRTGRNIVGPVTEDQIVRYDDANPTIPIWPQLGGLIPWRVPRLGAALLHFNERFYYCNIEKMECIQEVECNHPPVGSRSYLFIPYMEPLSLSSYTL